MKKVLACLAIGVLILSGIRAPEVFTTSRGICFSGPVLEKAADVTQNTLEFRKAAENPLLLHSGFAPSAHPFDFPETPLVTASAISDFSVSHANSLFSANTPFPHDRPPIVLSR